MATTSTTLNTPTIGRRRRANGTSRHIQHSPSTPTTGLRERGNDTSRSTGRSGRQNAATRRNMRREDRVTVQGPVKEQQPDGMLHRGFGGGANAPPHRIALRERMTFTKGTPQTFGLVGSRPPPPPPPKPRHLSQSLPPLLSASAPPLRVAQVPRRSCPQKCDTCFLMGTATAISCGAPTTAA